jgi:hypothetical protein
MSQLQVTGEAKVRDIQGPVVANSGVITALDGDASQYVRGDGTLADFPTSTGGGSSVSYYLNSSVSQGTIGGVAYRQLGKTPIIGAGTDITISANGYVASYITDANDPALLEVPAGNFNCEFYFSVNSNAHNPYVYAEVYKYDGTTFTLIGTSVGVPEYLSNGTTLSPYYFAIPVSQTVLTITDRIAIRIYVNVDGRVVTLHTENGHLCQVVTTFSKGLTSLNNLTRQVQFLATGTSGTDFGISSSVATHTFNLPVASAANTGKLSSTDWSTFNNKQNTITDPITGTGASGNVAYFNGTSSITSENSFNYDASTNRLGVNTTVPNATIGANAATDSGYSLLLKSDNANYNSIGFGTDSTYGNMITADRLGAAPSRNLTLYNYAGFISITEAGNLGIGLLTPNNGIDIYHDTQSQLWLHNNATGVTSTDGVRLALFNSKAANLRNFDGAMSISAEGDFSVITIGAENFRINSTDGSIYQSKVANAMLKSVSGVITAAVANTDYQAPITLTTTGSSGAATLVGSTLNIPDYSANTTNFVTIGTTQTITGTKTFDAAIRNESGLLLKNGVISGLSGYTSLGGNLSNGLVVQLSGGTNQQNLLFQTGGAYSYTFPAATGTLALTSDLSSYVPTSRELTINGTTYDLSANRSWTISTGITGSGVDGRVAYWDGTNSITSESGFIYDASSNRLGVNTNSPNGTIGANAPTDGIYSLLLKNSDTNYSGLGFGVSSTYGNTIETVRIGTAPSRNLTLYNYAGFISLTEAGNLGVGLLTPNTGVDIYHSTISSLWLHTATSGTSGTDGVRLSLNSSNNAVLRNNEGSLSMSSESDFYVITLGAENIRVNSANGFVGIGNPASLTSIFTVNGAITQSSVTSALLKTNASGTLVAAVAGTDYLAGSVISGTTDYIPRFTSSTTIGNSDISQDATFVTLNSKALSAPRARFNTAYDNASLSVNIFGQTYMDSRTSRLYQTFNLNGISNYMHIYDPFTSVNANGGFSIGASSSITLLPTTSIIHIDGVNSRVGIGTTAPTKTLSVNGSSYFNGTFTLAAGAGFMYDSLRFAYSNGTSVNYIYSGGSDGLYIANQADTEVLMRVTNSGNVGIGTITPDVLGFGWNTLTIRGGTSSGEAGVIELQSPSTTGAANLGIIAFLDGSNRNAQISVQRDTSTTTGNLLFYTNAGAGIVERMRITSGGNVGINTTGSTTSTPHLFLGTNLSMFNGGSDDSYFGSNFYYNSAWFYRTANKASMIQQDGGNIVFKNTDTTGTANGALTWSERMRITSDGTLRLTRASGTVDFSVFQTGGGDNFCDVSATSFRTNTHLPINDNTSALGSSGSRWSVVWAVNGSIQTSDEREKKDIVDTDLGLDFITKLRPVSFKWKVGQNIITSETITDEEGNETVKQVVTPREGKRTHYGLIAQEVEALLDGKDFGGFISDEETGLKGLRYDQFVPLLIKSIQEQQAQIEELKAKIK